jgi:hypothetical protein
MVQDGHFFSATVTLRPLALTWQSPCPIRASLDTGTKARFDKRLITVFSYVISQIESVETLGDLHDSIAKCKH